MKYELNNIYNEDCLEALKTFPDNYFDLVLTDPPYGKKWARGINGIGTNNQDIETDKCKWDNVPSKEVFDEMIRVSKNQIIFGFNHFMEHLVSSNCIIVWDKKGDVKDMGIFADCELAWTSFNRVIKKYIVRVIGFITDDKEKRIHPTQKPLKLIREIIKDFSSEGDLIVDCFNGSGTTTIACIDTNRNYICFELDKEYYNKSIERVEKYKKNNQKLPF